MREGSPLYMWGGSPLYIHTWQMWEGDRLWVVRACINSGATTDIFTSMHLSLIEP
jgi:hypothetical protein